MKILIKFTQFILLIFASLPFCVMAEQINPHTISVGQNNQCLSCHIQQPEIKDKLNTKNQPVDFSKFHADGIAMCTGCHAEEEGHVVGVKLKFSVPVDLPLGVEKSITCITCHYTHGDLDSDRPQASYSFMDRLLDSERLHKSFLIRRNNVNGELCLTCHIAQQSTEK